MADVNLPSFGDLSQMEFMSPLAYQQAQNQIGLANQFQQQNLALGQQDLQTKTLANAYSEAANPLRLQGLSLGNTSQQNANTISSLNANDALALAPEQRAAKRQKLLQEASDADLKKLMSDAEREYMSDDPVVSKRGENKLMHTKAELTRRNAAQDAYTRAADIANARADALKYSADTRLQGTQETNASRERIAAQKDETIRRKAEGNPKTAEAAAIKYQMDSDMENDPVEKARLAALAKQYGAYSMALKNAQAGTKPDMAQFGFSTNPVNMGVGSTNPSPRPTPGGNSGLAGGGANDQQNILLQEYQKATDPNDRAAIQRELARAGYKGQLPGSQPAGQPSQAPAGPANTAPAVGTVYKGYRFNGGDPSKKENWIKE